MLQTYFDYFENSFYLQIICGDTCAQIIENICLENHFPFVSHTPILCGNLSVVMSLHESEMKIVIYKSEVQMKLLFCLLILKKMNVSRLPKSLWMYSSYL